ncbi:MAG: CDP-diacylglycerol---glycerol-3-phosphate 3-phosphatidyltransferase [Frankiaceae bacterium]|nr:CDP-diacylglycerol---glycerol-3-phosphate 3-phosphatidyltransferase [Frankiaceae bacterium]
MLNLHVRPAIGRVVDPLARALLRTGVTPNAVTIVGTAGVTAGAFAFYPRGEFLVGTLVITAFIFNDMIDGSMARMRGSASPWGAFLDSTLDRVADASIFTALLLWFAGDGDQPALAAATSICLIGGALVSYIKAKAESLGLRCDVGLVERAERMLIVLFMTGFDGMGLPYAQAIGLWVLAAGTVVTIWQRFREVRRQIRLAEPAPGLQ